MSLNSDKPPIKQVCKNNAEIEGASNDTSFSVGLQEFNKLQSDIVNALTVIANRKEEIKKQGEVVKQEIHAIIEQVEREMTRQVETVIDTKLQVLSGQRKLAEMSMSQLKDCKEFVEQRLEKVVVSKREMMECTSHVIMNLAINSVNIDEFNPIEKADIHFIKKRKIDIGDVIYTTALQLCKVKEIDQRQIAYENEGVSFQLSIDFPNSLFLTIPLVLSCRVVSPDDTLINTTVTSTDHPRVYQIHCSPITMNGPYQVKLFINDVPLESALLVIPLNPYPESIASIRTIKLQYRLSGDAVIDDNGHIIVAQWSRISVLDRDGKEIKWLKIDGNATGIAIATDQFLVVTINNKNMIQKITMDGKVIASVGQ